MPTASARGCPTRAARASAVARVCVSECACSQGSDSVCSAGAFARGGPAVFAISLAPGFGVQGRVPGRVSRCGGQADGRAGPRGWFGQRGRFASALRIGRVRTGARQTQGSCHQGQG
eukprot:3590200-Lingulodinium_polyedra.AAC.1